MGRRLIDTGPAAEMLGLSDHTLENWRYLNKGPRYFRVGSRIKYDERDLEAWLESCVRGEVSVA